MPVDKYESENITIMQVVKLFLTMFNNFNANIRANDELSEEVEECIGRFERAEDVEHVHFLSLLNKSMERTKSDPQKDEGKHDPLQEIAQKIYRNLKFKRPDANFMMTLIKTFGERLLGSQNRAFHSIDKIYTDLVIAVAKNYSIIEPTTVVPLSTGEKKKRKKESSFSKKVKFR